MTTEDHRDSSDPQTSTNSAVVADVNDNVGPLAVLKQKPDLKEEPTVHNTTVTVHKFKLSNLVALVIMVLNSLYLLFQIAMIIMFSYYLNEYIELFQYRKQDILAANLSMATLSVICASIGYLVISISLFQRIEQRVITYTYLVSLIIFGVGQLISAGFLFPYKDDLQSVGIAVFIVAFFLYAVIIPTVIVRIYALTREDEIPDFEEKVKTPEQVIVRTPLMADIELDEVENAAV